MKNQWKHNWFVDLRINGSQIVQQQFLTTYGPLNSPTPQQWLLALESALSSLQLNGYSYDINIDNNTVTVFNNVSLVIGEMFVFHPRVSAKFFKSCEGMSFVTI